MVVDLGLGDVYLVVATAFQFALVGLLLLTRHLDRVRVALLVVIGVSGLQTLIVLVAGGYRATSSLAFLLDPLILLSLAFLATQFPVPLGGQAARGPVTVAWGGAMATWLVYHTIVEDPLGAWLGGESWVPGALTSLFREVPFGLTAGLVALHTVPRWLELERGPLRAQTLLVGAGLMASPGFQGALGTLSLVRDGLTLPSPTQSLVFVSFALAAWFGLAASVRLLWRVRGSRELASVVFGGLIALPLVLGAREEIFAGRPVGELLSQTYRPLLLAIAALRYDLFEIPTVARRSLAPVALVSLGIIVFLLPPLILSPEGLAAPSLDPGLAVLSLGLLIVLALRYRGSIDGLLHALAMEGPGHPERLESYRLKLERARQLGSPGAMAEVEETRRRLGISVVEHEVLTAVLDSSLNVPLSAIQGPRPGLVIDGRYRIERELGRGGRGRTFLAHDLGQDRRVVVKSVLRPWDREDARGQAHLETEAWVGRGLEARHLAGGHVLVQDRYHTYLVRDYVEGSTLGDIVEQSGPLTAQRACRLMEEILDGLQQLHKGGVLHLDLKPENVVVDRTDAAVVIDYGTARPTEPPEEGTRTATATVLGGHEGTLRWMAPEQIAGGRVDERTDVFAAGGLLHHMLTGRPPVPVEDRTAFQVQRSVLDGEPPPGLDDVPAGLREVIDQARAPDPADRFPSARALAQALARALPERAPDPSGDASA